MFRNKLKLDLADYFFNNSKQINKNESALIAECRNKRNLRQVILWSFLFSGVLWLLFGKSFFFSGNGNPNAFLPFVGISFVVICAVSFGISLFLYIKKAFSAKLAGILPSVFWTAVVVLIWLCCCLDFYENKSMEDFFIICAIIALIPVIDIVEGSLLFSVIVICQPVWIAVSGGGASYVFYSIAAGLFAFLTNQILYIRFIEHNLFDIRSAIENADMRQQIERYRILQSFSEEAVFEQYEDIVTIILQDKNNYSGNEQRNQTSVSIKLSNIVRYIYKEDMPLVREAYEKRSLSNPSGFFDARTDLFDGEMQWYHVVFASIFDERGKVVRTIGKLYNVDEKKRQENRAELTKQQMILAIRHIYYDAIVINLNQNTFNTITPEMEKSPLGSGIPYSEAIVQFVTKGRINEDNNDECLNVCDIDNLEKLFTGNEKTLNYECRVLEQDGKYHWLSLTFTPIEDTKDDERLVLLLVMNIDRQKDIEESLRAAINSAECANHSKTDFLSRMSHDIRTPLNAIVGMTAMAIKNRNNPEKQIDCLKKIKYSADYLTSLVNDLLDMTHIEEGKVTLSAEEFSLGEFLDTIRSVITLQTAKKNINFKISEENADFDTIIGDKLRLNRVLMNLLTNAVKFTDENGTISFTANVKSHEGGKAVICFSVEDNGIGMSKEFMGKMFEPFAQEKRVLVNDYGSSGLGLSICRSLIAIMGGHISAESEEGKGTRFDVELVFDVPEKQGSGKNSIIKEIEDIIPDLSGRTIMVVEDNPVNVEIDCTILEETKADIIICENGAEAVEKFASMPENSVALIFMDVVMPVMTGLEASELIRAMNRTDAKTIPIVAMTANAYNEDIVKSFASGMNDHLAKPIQPETMYRVIAKLVK